MNRSRLKDYLLLYSISHHFFLSCFPVHFCYMFVHLNLRLVETLCHANFYQTQLEFHATQTSHSTPIGSILFFLSEVKYKPGAYFVTTHKELKNMLLTEFKGLTSSSVTCFLLLNGNFRRDDTSGGRYFGATGL